MLLDETAASRDISVKQFDKLPTKSHWENKAVDRLEKPLELCVGGIEPASRKCWKLTTDTAVAAELNSQCNPSLGEKPLRALPDD